MENGNLIWWVFCFCDFPAFRKIGYGGRVGRGGKSGVHLMFFPFRLSTERGKKKINFGYIDMRILVCFMIKIGKREYLHLTNVIGVQ